MQSAYDAMQSSYVNDVYMQRMNQMAAAQAIGMQSAISASFGTSVAEQKQPNNTLLLIEDER